MIIPSVNQEVSIPVRHLEEKGPEWWSWKEMSSLEIEEIIPMAMDFLTGSKIEAIAVSEVTHRIIYLAFKDCVKLSFKINIGSKVYFHPVTTWVVQTQNTHDLLWWCIWKYRSLSYSSRIKRWKYKIIG